MIVGAKVVCVDGAFSDLIKLLYRQLPVKGGVYTIRQVSLCRDTIQSKKGSATVGVLLNEIVNGPDPLHVGNAELGFSAERFREIEEAEAASRELVGREAA